ncbi:hypothetical protein SDC9_137803 [bioreactor metagenome]|uniref:Uncharacterized protein n=1 Tax=bioreactor metagenome TaxID=1076179 RepID=A0A645DN37_9ZZZZ
MFQRQRDMRQRQHGGGDAPCHQHIQVGELRAQKKQRLHQQHHRDAISQLATAPAQGEQIKRERCQHAAHERGKSRRPLMYAQHRVGARRQPIEQRWFVKKRQSVERGRQPIAGAQHLPRDACVTPFIRHHQWPQPCRGAQPQHDSNQHPTVAPEGAPLPRTTHACSRNPRPISRLTT